MKARAFRDRSARATYESHVGPNMTPMVDVVMVILIFFMASAVVLGPEWFLAARLPKEGAVADASAPPPMRLTLRVTRDASGATVVLAGDQRTSLAALADTLAGMVPADKRADAVVLVESDDAVPYEDVVRVHAACAAAGLRKVGLHAP